MGCVSSKVVLARTTSTSSGRHRRHHHHHHQFNRHLLAFLSPSSQPPISALHLDHNLTDFEDAKQTIDALELMPDSKHDDLIDNRDVDSTTDSNCHRISKSYQSSPNYEKRDTIERCASFHTVEEYEVLIQRISRSGGEEIIKTVDDDQRGMRRKKRGEALTGSLNVEFQTVGSLRQWLDDHIHDPPGGGDGGGGGGDEGSEILTPKFGSYYNNNHNTEGAGVDSIFMAIGGKQEEEESVPEVDPDLVAAFEEYMQQLQVEEDNILKLMEDDRTP